MDKVPDDDGQPCHERLRDRFSPALNRRIERFFERSRERGKADRLVYDQPFRALEAWGRAQGWSYEKVHAEMHERLSDRDDWFWQPYKDGYVKAVTEGERAGYQALVAYLTFSVNNPNVFWSYGSWCIVRVPGAHPQIEVRRRQRLLRGGTGDAAFDKVLEFVDAHGLGGPPARESAQQRQRVLTDEMRTTLLQQFGHERWKRGGTVKIGDDFVMATLPEHLLDAATLDHLADTGIAVAQVLERQAPEAL